MLQEYQIGKYRSHLTPVVIYEEINLGRAYNLPNFFLVS
jgi:hypothetical protein